MKILTKKNGIALVAVLTVLLVLTLLLPVMFTMSETATKESIKGQDQQRSSYLARTMIEMTVSAFQDCYDAAEDEVSDGADITSTDSYTYKLERFYEIKTMEANTLYMYRDTGLEYPVKPVRGDFSTDSEYQNALDEYEEDFYEYEKNGIIYSVSLPDGVADEGGLNKSDTYSIIAPVVNADGTTTDRTRTCKYVGKAECSVVYDDAEEYYKTVLNPETGAYETFLVVEEGGVSPEQQYQNYIDNTKALLASNGELSETAPQFSKIEKRNVVFRSVADVNGKVETRRCVLVLPTKPSEQNWIVPANVESNQIFVDSASATSVKALKIDNSYFVDKGAATGQPVYIFSCIGNMVISTEGLKIKDGSNYVDYKEYILAHPDYPSQLADFSLGAHPITTTVNPENDPTFSCVKTNNMRSWAKSAQKDNFVAFTATNGIEVDMPVNLLINPCRTGRIGDGLDANQSLYKIMYFQSPVIVFKQSVNSFISLYQKTSVLATVLDYNAYRMSSLMFAAPQSTPYSYYNKSRGKTVKAGKVYFMEDAYVWLVPFTEDGSNYKTQTVYYKGKDIILYKFANAGDVYLFNNEVETNIQGDTVKAGFSMTGYFMDVLYNKEETQRDNLKWWQFWSQLQNWIFNASMDAFRDTTYIEEDLKYVGNIHSGGADSVPVIDDFYVVWDS